MKKGRLQTVSPRKRHHALVSWVLSKTENYIKPKFLITVLNVNILKINMQKILKNYNEHNRLI